MNRYTAQHYGLHIIFLCKFTYHVLNAIYTLRASGLEFDPWPNVQLRVSFTGEVDVEKNNTHIATVL